MALLMCQTHYTPTQRETPVLVLIDNRLPNKELKSKCYGCILIEILFTLRLGVS